MSNFRTSPYFPVLKHRTPDDVNTVPQEVVVEHIQLPQAYPMSVIEAGIMDTTMAPPPRPLIRYLPPSIPVQMQFDILEARLDTLYLKCESVLRYQGRFVSEIITYTQRLLALAPDLTTPGSPALGKHLEKGRQLKHILASVKLEMWLVHGVFFSEVRAPIFELQGALLRAPAPLYIRFRSRVERIQARIEDGERCLIVYDRISNTTAYKLWYELFREIPSFKGYKHMSNKSESRRTKDKYGNELQRLLYSLIRRRGLPPYWPFVDGKFLACFDSDYLQFASITPIWVPTGTLSMRLAHEVSTRAEHLVSLRQSHSEGSSELGFSGIFDSPHSNPEIDYDGSNDWTSDGSDIESNDSTSDESDIDSVDGSNTSLSSRHVDAPISHGWPYIPPLNYGDSDDDSGLETE